jgi:hypothetical protein
MKQTSLKKFKKKVKELQLQQELILNALEQQISHDVLSKGIVSPSTYVSTGTGNIAVKPYLNIKLVNDVLTIILNDGSIITKPNATANDFNSARSANNEDQLFSIVGSTEVLEEKRKRAEELERLRRISAGISKLGELSDFTVDGDSVYLTGINRSLPQLMVEKFLEIIGKHEGNTRLGVELALMEDDEFQSLKRFFMWCCLNPRAEVAHELYRFLEENSFRITKQGFFVALRNVVTLHGSNELVQFVSNAYNKIKAVWKKSPDNYHVFLENGDYVLVHIDDVYEEITEECGVCEGEGNFWDGDFDEEIECDECWGGGSVTSTITKQQGKDLGTLTALYLDLPNRAENRFTDDWTKTFDIRIGKPVTMPTEECNWSTQDCAAAGLHFTADQIHYVGCGDQSVLVLINPMKIVGIGQHKGRCYEYLPIMTVDREEATEILHDLDFDTLALDEQYVIDELENLSETVKNNFAAESRKYDFNFPHISSNEVHNIILSLDDMKSVISNRVNVVD